MEEKISKCYRTVGSSVKDQGFPLFYCLIAKWTAQVHRDLRFHLADKCLFVITVCCDDCFGILLPSLAYFFHRNSPEQN